MENMYIEKRIENALLNTGMTREDIVGVRASSNAEYMKATGKKRRGKLTQNGELSYLQYGELFFLIYTIEGDVEETDHNPFIGGNSIVAVGKRPMTQNKILSYYEKSIIDSEDFFAPFIFPRLLWTKGYISTIKNITTPLFEKCYFYHDPSGKTYDSRGEDFSNIDSSLMGRYWAYTLRGVAALLAEIECLSDRQKALVRDLPEKTLEI